MPTPGPLELVIILVIALLVLGPGRLPDVGSALGKSLREFRKASSDIQDAVKVDTSPLAARRRRSSRRPRPPAAATARSEPPSPAPVGPRGPGRGRCPGAAPGGAAGRGPGRGRRTAGSCRRRRAVEPAPAEASRRLRPLRSTDSSGSENAS